MPADLAHALHGHGPSHVLVLHDWLGDRGNWDPMLPYLDGERFTYALVDLRGYGGSRALTGAYTAEEAAGDALAVAARLGWERFAAVGHSMSGLIVQQMAAAAPSKVARIVAVTPVGPGGLPAPPEVRAAMERVALDPSRRRAALVHMWGDRLSERWIDSKLARWNATSEPQAVLGYLRMFSATDLRARVAGLDVPILVIAGEHDQPHFSAGALRTAFAAYPRLEVVTCGNAGHYPMQETPVALATTMERFLAQGA
jgi:pimeloyl-ACP methyl ester carboxylesterase